VRQHHAMRGHRLAVLGIDRGRVGTDEAHTLRGQPGDGFGRDGGEGAVPTIVREAREGAQQHPGHQVQRRQVGDLHDALRGAGVDHQAFAQVGIKVDRGDVGAVGRIVQRRVAMRARMRAHGHSSDVDGGAVFHPPAAFECEGGVAGPHRQARAQRLADVPEASRAHSAVRTLSNSGKNACFSTPAR
jgi:hypothetical protein